MPTTNATVTSTRVKGGSFLIEERQPQEIFTPEDFSEGAAANCQDDHGIHRQRGDAGRRGD